MYILGHRILKMRVKSGRYSGVKDDAGALATVARWNLPVPLPSFVDGDNEISVSDTGCLAYLRTKDENCFELITLAEGVEKILVKGDLKARKLGEQGQQIWEGQDRQGQMFVVTALGPTETAH